MAWIDLGNIAVAQSSVSESSFAAFSVSASAGDVLVLMVSADNTGTTAGASSEVSGVTGGGTWTKAHEFRRSAGAAGDGVIVSLWHCRVTSGFSNQPIAINFSGARTKKCAIVRRFQGTAGQAITVEASTGETTANADPGALTLSGLASGEYLFFRAFGSEIGSYSLAPTSGFTDTGTNTTGNGGGDTEISLGGEFVIATATSATSNPTHAAADTASVFVALKEGTTTSPRTGTLSKTLAAVTSSASGTNAATAPSQDGKIGSLSDDFNDNSINTAKWVVETSGGATVTESTQRLNINIGAGALRYGALRSAARYSGTDSNLGLRLIQPITGHLSFETYFVLGSDADALNGDDFTGWIFLNGEMNAATMVAGTLTKHFTATYDATNHAWLRIRHNSEPSTTITLQGKLYDDQFTGHMAYAHGVNPSWAWGSGPYRDPSANGTTITYPVGYDPHLTPWGVVASDQAGSPATNVRVQMRKVCLDYKAANGTWIRGQYVTQDTELGGALYTNYETNTTAPANTQNHGVDGISVKLPDEGGSFHWFPNIARFDVPTDATEIAVRYEARMIVDNVTLTDDRASAKILAMAGIDVWKSLTQEWNGTDSNYAVAMGRFSYVTNDWQSFSSHTLWTTAEIDDYLASGQGASPAILPGQGSGPGGPTIYYEVAPSTAANPPLASEWITLHSRTPAMSIADVAVVLMAGGWDTANPGGAAIFDSVHSTYMAPATNTAPQFVAQSSAQATDAAANLVQTVPEGVVSGDLLVWIVHTDMTTVQSFPAGWTKVIDRAGSADGARLSIATRTANAEPASYTFTPAAAVWTSSIMAAYRGQNLSVDAFTSTAVNTLQSSPYVFPNVGLNTNVDDTRLLWIALADNTDFSNSWSFSAPSGQGFSHRATVNSTYCPLGLADKEQAASGPTGSIIGTGTGGAPAGLIAATIAIKTTAAASGRFGTLSKTLGAVTSSGTIVPQIGSGTNKTLGAVTLVATAATSLSVQQQDFETWLTNDQAARVVLVEAQVMIGDTETTRYMSNRGYVSQPTDSPANTLYEPVIVGGIAMSESLGVDGSASIQYGDFEIDNFDGSRNEWLGDTWMNRPIRVYIGDASWARSQFRLVMAGIIYNVDSRSNKRLNIVMRDKLQRLNTPVTEEVLGGLSLNSERLLPLAFGEVHNIEPLLIDPPTLTYQYHQGASFRIIEVRDNGVPVSFEGNLTASTFRLLARPAGVITCSVQGDATPTYGISAAQIVRRIATGFGKATDRFTESDIDGALMQVFDNANPQALGIAITDRTNVLDACEQIAGSIGAQLSMTREGLLRLLRLELPPPTYAYPLANITEADFVFDSFQVVSRSEVSAAVKIAYCKNWTVQANLLTKLPPEHKQLYRREWLTATRRDDTVALRYRLHKEPNQEETLLLAKADAENEAQRRLDLRKTQRTTYRFEGYASSLQLKLGQAIFVTTSRYDLEAGVLGMVTALEPDWLKSRCAVEFMV